jgi:hypothetical protein
MDGQRQIHGTHDSSMVLLRVEPIWLSQYQQYWENNLLNPSLVVQRVSAWSRMVSIRTRTNLGRMPALFGVNSAFRRRSRSLGASVA